MKSSSSPSFVLFSAERSPPRPAFWRIMKSPALFLSFVLFSVLFGAGCSCSGGLNRTDWEPFSDMIQQRSVKPQEGSAEGGLSMRLPPEGARARGRAYYPFSGKPLLAGQRLKNPLPPSRQILEEGEIYYKKFCIYCHGAAGDSQAGALVAPKMAIQPASLLTAKARAYSDGRIYHIIYNGQGLMGPYRIQLAGSKAPMREYWREGEYQGRRKIWALIHYIRKLQKESEN